jgi:hypothetical protein
LAQYRPTSKPSYVVVDEWRPFDVRWRHSLRTAPERAAAKAPNRVADAPVFEDLLGNERQLPNSLFLSTARQDASDPSGKDHWPVLFSPVESAMYAEIVNGPRRTANSAFHALTQGGPADLALRLDGAWRRILPIET